MFDGYTIRWLDCQTVIQLDGYTVRWLDRQTVRWLDVQKVRQLDDQTVKRLDSKIFGWSDGYMDRRLDSQTVKQLDGQSVKQLAGYLYPIYRAGLSVCSTQKIVALQTDPDPNIVEVGGVADGELVRSPFQAHAPIGQHHTQTGS